MNKKIIPLSVPEVRGNEWKYIKDCLDTGWVSSVGAYVEKFEQIMKDYVGAKHAVACVNGTGALHVSLIVSDIGYNDEVIVPALTFVAPVNAVSYTGAYPVFIDVEPDTWQLDPQKIKGFIEGECEYKNGTLVNKNTKRQVKAIIPVHLLGHPVDMDPILEIAKKYELSVIEDAAESIGAEYKGRKIGTLGDITCFSFNGNKIITTGGGGMLVTDNEEYARQAKYLTTQAKDDPVESIHKAIGFNYRLTNIQAAMGVAQMEALDEYIEIKRSIAKRYSNEFKNMEGITILEEKDWARSVFWLYTILIDKDKFGTDRKQLMERLNQKGIQTRPLWHPVYKLEPFEDCYSYNIKDADILYEKGLSLPSSVGLTQDDQQYVIDSIKESK